MTLFEQIKDKLTWSSISSVNYRPKQKPSGLFSWNSVASITIKPKKKEEKVKKVRRVKRVKTVDTRKKPIYEDTKIVELSPQIGKKRIKEVYTEEYEDDIEDEVRKPLTVKDYKLIYYYRTMTLIISLLVVLLIFVIHMVQNDMTITDLIPDKIRAIYTSKYFHKIISLIKGMN